MKNVECVKIWVEKIQIVNNISSHFCTFAPGCGKVPLPSLPVLGYEIQQTLY